MKKLFTLLSLALAVATVSAATLTPQEALSRATRSSQKAKSIAAKTDAPQLVRTVETPAGLPAVYTFRTSENEVLVVSADDVATPLLGYCDVAVEGDGNSLPPEMEWWLNQYAAEIETATLTAMPAKAPAGKVRLNAGETEKTPVAPLCQTLWNQSMPFNAMCPMVSNQRTVTGCVATAMAQVMKYHNWPAQGSGSISYKTNAGVSYSMNLAVTFDWANMLNDYSGSYTTAQKNAVALLMKACGYSVQMDYAVDGSGTSDYYCVGAFTKNFGYDSATRICERQYYGLTDWQDMIYNNIVNVGPVLYCGSAPEGGHAFVCDGYSTDGYFHFNWGWGGMYNGYFQLTALNPEGQGIGGFAGGYNSNQSILLGIRPPVAGSERPSPQLSQQPGYTGSVSNGTLTVDGTWYNLMGYDIDVCVSLRFLPVNGGTPKYYTYNSMTIQNMSGIGGQNITLSNVGLANGTYQVAMGVKQNANSQWMPSFTPMNEAGYFLLTKSNNTYSVSNPAPGELTYSNPQVLTPLYLGCKAKLAYTVSNNSNYEVTQNIEPVLVTGSSIVASGSPLCFDLTPGESRNVEMIFDLSGSTSLSSTSSYNLYLYDPSDGYAYLNFGTVTPKANPGTPSLSVTNFTLEGAPAAVDLTDMHFNATVQCTYGYFADPLQVVITNSSNAILADAASKDVYFLNKGQSANTAITMDFSQGTPGQTYTAALCYLSGNQYVALATLNFSGETSGITETAVETDGIGFDATSQTIVFPAGATEIEVVSVSGIPVKYTAVETESGTIVDLSQAAEGVAVATATVNGKRVSTKVVLQ